LADNALLSFCDFKDISVIITDRPLNSEYMQANALRHIQVITPQKQADHTVGLD
jgi:DeoR/GlpR family transcriptional regulator of sugar metabolism